VPSLEAWYRFDAVWLTHVARNGYANASDSGGRLGVAFMPAAPAVMAGAEVAGLNMFLIGVLVPNLCGAAGAALFARVAARELNSAYCGWVALGLLLAFPTAFFYSAPYNESFGLLFTATALAAWQSRRSALAGLGALGGSLARLTGIALALAAVCDWLRRPRRADLGRAVAVASGSVGGLILAWALLWWTVGDPLAGVKVQTAWGREELSWRNPVRTIRSIYDPDLPHYGEAVVVLGAGLLGVRALIRRGTFWGVLILAPVAQMFASGTLLSGHRLILAALPAFIELADLLRGRRVPLVATLACFTLVQVYLLDLYVHWRFAG
jgi:hypothetical protein